MMNTKKLNLFISILLSFSYSLFTNEKPNFIVILADDMGYGDVGYHGYPELITPNIDALAEGGTHFSQGYSCASVCGPSRSGLLTGVYQQRMGVYGNMGDRGGVPTSQSILPEMLKQKGYTCGVVGKWGIGLKDESMLPNNRGVDYFYGFLGGAHSYTKSSSTAKFKKQSEAPIYRNQNIVPPIQKENGYLTDLFNQEALGFIERNHKKPFFLYLAYNAVHSPWVAPQKYKDRLKHLTLSEDQLVFSAMKLALDDGVGAINNLLKEKGLKENTMIIFLSDNGSPRGQGLTPDKDLTKDRGNTTMSSPGNFRGFKGDVYEGGTRIPFIINHPKTIPPGQVYHKPVISLDVAPTIMSFFNNNPPTGLPFDGVNLIPHLNQALPEKSQPHSTLYWRRGDDYAILKDGWKLEWNDAGSTKEIQLFNLKTDKDETKNLCYTHPEKAQYLQDQFDAWDSQLADNQTKKKFLNRNSQYSKGHRVNVANFNLNQKKLAFSKSKKSKKTKN